MNQCPYCSKEFKTWKSVRAHTSSCTKNTGEYYVHQGLGPIHYTKIMDYQFTFSTLNAVACFRRRGIHIPNFQLKWTKESCIQAIKDFHAENKYTPQVRDFEASEGKYPSNTVIRKHFAFWNKAIEAAGFGPNIQSGFGILTYGKDGHLYRSRAEANFADTCLFEKYDYQIEPHYPAPHSDWLYDWYVCDLDLYIELDGGLRPERILEKIAFNEELGRECLVISN